jgi:hypothetical protein
MVLPVRSTLGWAAPWWIGPAEGLTLAVIGAALAGMWARGLPQAQRNQLSEEQVRQGEGSSAPWG